MKTMSQVMSARANNKVEFVLQYWDRQSKKTLRHHRNRFKASGSVVDCMKPRYAYRHTRMAKRPLQTAQTATGLTMSGCPAKLEIIHQEYAIEQRNGIKRAPAPRPKSTA
ncbi:hypothetical protein Pmani_020973 [Petrolisthes manimaculis]|uniref:Uncharacterized protein n=1 Tax=Petrolisthes manimaculis TaxID=1843537 RepID=A0AAE1PEP4_9EUCA|nr:hypothetical protein Pmani_020973 [Petrolisthes manimaculis]